MDGDATFIQRTEDAETVECDFAKGGIAVDGTYSLLSVKILGDAPIKSRYGE